MRKEFSPLKWAASHFQLTLSIGIATVLGVVGLLLNASADNQQAGLLQKGINDAQLVMIDNTGHGNNQVVPGGQAFTIIVAMANKSKQAGAKLNTWTTPNYRLGISNPQDAQKFGPDAGRTIVRADVPQNGIEPFVIKMVAPATPGVYTFKVRMVQEGVEWFGQEVPLSVTVTKPLIPSIDDAMLETKNIPDVRLFPGQAGNLYIAMRNKTQRQNVNLNIWDASYALGTADDFRFGLDATRSRVDGKVGNTNADNYKNFLVKIVAPSTPGTYTMTLQMVHEGVAWFGEKAVVKVIVSEPTKGVCSGTFGDGQIAADTYLLQVGQLPKYSVEFANTGTDTWQAGQYYIKQDMSVTGTKIFDQNYALALPSNLETWQHGRADVIFPQINSDALVPGNYVIPLSVYVDYNGSTSGFTRVQRKITDNCVIKIKVVAPQYNAKAVPDKMKAEALSVTEGSLQPSFFDTNSTFEPGQQIGVSFAFTNIKQDGAAELAWTTAKQIGVSVKDSRTGKEIGLMGNKWIYRGDTVRPGANLEVSRLGFMLPKDIQPGSYTLNVQLVSPYGNFGETYKIPYTVVKTLHDATAIPAEMKIERVLTNNWPNMTYADTSGVFTPDSTIMISGAFKNPSKDGYVPAWNNWDVSMNMFDSRTNQSIRSIKLDATVLPGGNGFWTRNFYGVYVIPANAKPGNYTITLSLEYNGMKFGESFDIPYTIVAAKDDAKCITAPADITVAAGQPFTLSYSMQNTGNTYFTPNTYRIMLDSAPYMVNAQVYTPGDVAPQATVSLTVPVTINIPGTYTVNGRMSPGYNTRFGEACTSKVIVQPLDAVAR